MQDVLGLSSLVMPTVTYVATPYPASHPAVSETAPHMPSLLPRATLPVRVRGSLAAARLIAVWQRTSGLGEAEILAEKMVSAMKVPPAQVLWVDWEAAAPGELAPEVLQLLRDAGERPILVFGAPTAVKILPELAGRPLPKILGNWIQSRYLVTLSPEELLDSAEKKKIAWAHLQLVMKNL